MFNGSIGPLEIVLVLGIVLLIFGPKRLPGLGKQLGQGMREFKESITGNDRDDEDDETEQATVEPAAPTDAPAATEGEDSRAAAAEALGTESSGGRSGKA